MASISNLCIVEVWCKYSKGIKTLGFIVWSVQLMRESANALEFFHKGCDFLKNTLL